jgi:peptidoglycan hydrolase-like protein with peptidoglycan-binding domain
MSRTLRKGMSGPDVVQLHAALNWHLPPPSDQLPVTGSGADTFGPRTEAKVIEFQKLLGLDPDGVVGKDTRPLIFSAHDVNLAIYRHISPDAGVPQLVPGLRPFPGLLQPFPGLQRAMPVPLPMMPGKIPPMNIPPPKLHLDNIKLQAQDQQTILSVHSFSSLVVAVNATLLTRQKGPHLELSFGPQVAFNTTQNDSRVDGSVVAQVSAADLVGSDDPRHFSLALFSQATAQISLSQEGPLTGQFGAGAQVQFTILKDRLTLFWQAMPFLSIDTTGKFTVGAQIVSGMGLQVLGF